MSIIESLKTQLKSLEAQRREHEKAANAIRRNEVKIRKALASVASLPAVAQS
jgi:energy-converting hydrogenase Eha subunit H